MCLTGRGGNPLVFSPHQRRWQKEFALQRFVIGEPLRVR